LAGIDKPPLQIANARYRLVAGPEIGEEKWIRFDLDLHADFQRQWGSVPKGYSKIRVLFEVRYDEKEAGDGEVRADAYYDDLYLASEDSCCWSSYMGSVSIFLESSYLLLP
jgi:hypothetical protein